MMSLKLTVLQQSKEQGFDSYEIQISLREDCLLKAARVFMVFEVLEKIGEVIKSVPAVEQLEEEQFDHIFQVTIISQKNQQEDIEKKIMKVSEVDKVDVHAIEFRTVTSCSYCKRKMRLFQKIKTNKPRPYEI